MPQAVLVAALPSLVGVGGALIGSRSQGGANKRALAASAAAAAKAEAFERERAAVDDATDARVAAEEKHRWEVEQTNKAADKAQEDALLRDQLARQDYTDQLTYQKRVNLARLTGQAPPPPMPTRTSLNSVTSAPLTIGGLAKGVSGPMASRPAQASQMIAAPGASDPWALPPGVLPSPPLPPSPSDAARYPIRRLSGRGY